MTGVTQKLGAAMQSEVERRKRNRLHKGKFLGEAGLEFLLPTVNAMLWVPGIWVWNAWVPGTRECNAVGTNSSHGEFNAASRGNHPPMELP